MQDILPTIVGSLRNSRKHCYMKRIALPRYTQLNHAFFVQYLFDKQTGLGSQHYSSWDIWRMTISENKHSTTYKFLVKIKKMLTAFQGPKLSTGWGSTCFQQQNLAPVAPLWIFSASALPCSFCSSKMPVISKCFTTWGQNFRPNFILGLRHSHVLEQQLIERCLLIKPGYCSEAKFSIPECDCALQAYKSWLWLAAYENCNTLLRSYWNDHQAMPCKIFKCEMEEKAMSCNLLILCKSCFA